MFPARRRGAALHRARGFLSAWGRSFALSPGRGPFLHAGKMIVIAILREKFHARPREIGRLLILILLQQRDERLVNLFGEFSLFILDLAAFARRLAACETQIDQAACWQGRDRVILAGREATPRGHCRFQRKLRRKPLLYLLYAGGRACLVINDVECAIIAQVNAVSLTDEADGAGETFRDQNFAARFGIGMVESV